MIKAITGISLCVLFFACSSSDENPSSPATNDGGASGTSGGGTSSGDTTSGGTSSGGTSGGGTSSSGDAGDGTVSTPIVAATGGKVTIGGASLDVAPGALKSNKTITVSTHAPAATPDPSSVVGLVYDFGPDGTTFDPAAKLVLPLPSAPAADKKAVISYVSGNAWVDLESTTADGKVSAAVPHFTSFAARFIAAAQNPTIDYPSAVGFELQGKHFDLKPNTSGCAAIAAAMTYNANEGGTSSITDATIYQTFPGAKLPAAGTYAVADATVYPIPAGKVTVSINDARDHADYWNSEGTGGTLQVAVLADGSIDIVWHDVPVVRGKSAASGGPIPPGTKSTTTGWQKCPAPM